MIAAFIVLKHGCTVPNALRDLLLATLRDEWGGGGRMGTLAFVDMLRVGIAEG